MSENFKSFVNSFSKFFQRNKKFQKKHFLSITIIVLFIVMSVSVPVYQAQASIVNIGSEFLLKAIGHILESGIDVLRNFIYAILFAVLNMGLMLSIVLVKFGAWCIDVALDPRLYMGEPTAVPPVPGVLVSSTVDTGWRTVRDMCNTFYLFFLLIIAFGTILRSSTFNAKNLLPKLVLSLFLINFSAVIAKLVIDFGQVFMYEIMSWMGTFQGGGGSLTSIVDQFNAQINNAGLQASLDQVILVAFALTYSLALGFVYIMLAIFLLIRLVAFVFLIILSPIAFLSIVLPSMSKYTSEWWSELIKYSLIGPIFMFFVYLSATMANEMVSNFTPLPVTNTGFDAVKDLVVIMIPHSIALFMLLAVIPITQRLGVAGSNKIIGGTAGIGKIAMGTYAGVKLAGGLGRKVGGGVVNRNKTLSRGADWAKRGAYGLAGGVPGLKGAALRGKAGVEKKRQEKLQKMEMDMGDLKNIDLTILESKANGIRGYGGTTEDKALLLKAAATQGKLGDKNKDGTLKYEKFFEGAEPALGKKDMDEITNKNLSFATMTNEGKEKISEYEKTKDPETNKEYTTEEAKELVMRDKMADLIRDGKAHEVQDLDDATTAKIWHESQDSDQRKSSINRMAKDQKEKLSDGYLKNVKKLDEDGNIVNGKGKIVRRDDGSSEFEDEKNKIKEDTNIKFSTNSVKLGKDLEKSFAWGGTEAGEKISEAFKDFSAKEVAKLSNEDLEKHGHNANASQISNLNRASEYEAINSIESSKKGKIGKIKEGDTPSNDLEREYKAYNDEKKTINEERKGKEKDLKKESRKKEEERDQTKIEELENDLEDIESSLKDLDNNNSAIVEGENDLKHIRDTLAGKKNK